MQSTENSARQGAPRESLEAKLKREAEKFVRERLAETTPTTLSGLTRDVAHEQHSHPETPVAREILAHLQKALRRERQKSRLGHAGYDFNRHLALHQAIRHLSGQALPNGKAGMA